MPIPIGNNHLLHNLLDILVGGFNNPIHLRAIQRRIMMLNHEGLTKLLHHLVVEIRSIVRNDLL